MSIVNLSYDKLIALIIIFLILYVLVSIILVYGETEKQCTEYSSNHLVIIYLSNLDDRLAGCDWLVDKYLSNGSGFELSHFAITGYAYHERIFVLTK